MKSIETYPFATLYARYVGKAISRKEDSLATDGTFLRTGIITDLLIIDEYYYCVILWDEDYVPYHDGIPPRDLTIVEDSTKDYTIELCCDTIKLQEIIDNKSGVWNV